MHFTQSDLSERIEYAAKVREPITLTADEVGDLDEARPYEEELIEHWIENLQEMDVRGLRITKKAQRAITEALGLSDGDIWGTA